MLHSKLAPFILRVVQTSNVTLLHHLFEGNRAFSISHVEHNSPFIWRQSFSWDSLSTIHPFCVAQNSNSGNSSVWMKYWYIILILLIWTNIMIQENMNGENGNSFCTWEHSNSDVGDRLCMTRSCEQLLGEVVLSGKYISIIFIFCVTRLLRILMNNGWGY